VLGIATKLWGKATDAVLEVARRHVRNATLCVRNMSVTSNRFASRSGVPKTQGVSTPLLLQSLKLWEGRQVCSSSLCVRDMCASLHRFASNSGVQETQGSVYMCPHVEGEASEESTRPKVDTFHQNPFYHSKPRQQMDTPQPTGFTFIFHAQHKHTTATKVLLSYKLGECNVPLSYKLGACKVPLSYKLGACKVPLSYKLSACKVPLSYKLGACKVPLSYKLGACKVPLSYKLGACKVPLSYKLSACKVPLSYKLGA